jgi:endonuclease YncB( thermonuclease family)
MDHRVSLNPRKLNAQAIAFGKSLFNQCLHPQASATLPVSVRVEKARDLAARDTGIFQSGLSDPYAVVRIQHKSGRRRKLGETAVAPKTLDPEWSEEFCGHASREDVSVVVEVYDKDTTSRDDPLGAVSIPLFGDPGKLKLQWHVLVGPPSVGLITGAIQILVQVDNSTLVDSFNIDNSKKERGRHNPAKHACAGLTYATCKPYLPSFNFAKCVRVYDGDTFHLATFLPSDTCKAEPVRFSCRLNGVDTPELRTKDTDEKAAAVVARDLVKELILGKVVDVEVQGWDKYGRLLVAVQVPASLTRTPD